MVYDSLRKLLELHEGNRRLPYKDTVGKLTIGLGFNLTDVGLYPEEIEFVYENRIRRLANEVERALPWAADLDPVRLTVIMDMAYNLGVPGLLGFKRTLNTVKQGDYALASRQMLESKWAGQVGRRARRLSEMMRTGEWPTS